MKPNWGLSVWQNRRTSILKFSVSYEKDTTKDFEVEQLMRPWTYRTEPEEICYLKLGNVQLNVANINAVRESSPCQINKKIRFRKLSDLPDIHMEIIWPTWYSHGNHLTYLIFTWKSSDLPDIHMEIIWPTWYSHRRHYSWTSSQGS